MAPETATPKGHMTLTVYSSDGTILDEVAQHNRVLDGGRLWLLRLLSGDSAVGEHALILGAEGFKPDIANPLEQDAIIPVKLTGKVTAKMSGKELVVTFKGNAGTKGVVTGGGIVIAGKLGDKETRDLYNFAETPRPVELAEGQSVSVNFRLAME